MVDGRLSTSRDFPFSLADVTLSPFLIGLLGVLLSGCVDVVNVRPISSTPPASAILVRSAFQATIMGTVPGTVPGDTATFPAGEYRPLYENERGYFFEAPAKATIIQYFGATSTETCGLYVARGSTEPTQWYLVERNFDEPGRIQMGALVTVPPHDLRP